MTTIIYDNSTMGKNLASSLSFFTTCEVVNDEAELEERVQGSNVNSVVVTVNNSDELEARRRAVRGLINIPSIFITSDRDLLANYRIINATDIKKIVEELRLKVSNMIWVRCNIKAFLLEEEIGLPVHIPLPRLSK